MRKSAILAVLAPGVLACLGGDDAQQRLAGRAFGATPLYRDLQELCDRAGFESSENPLDAIDGTDNLDFLLTGVPNLVANQDAVPYLPDYHAESDTLDKVNWREARANSALASGLVWWLAENPERFGRRLTPDEVRKLVVDSKLDAQMKAFGQWDDWQAGRRMPQ